MKIAKSNINYLLICFLIPLFGMTTYSVNAQSQYLEITNLKTKRIKKLKENKKITVFTKDLKVKGPLKVLDSETILIRDTEIKISDIELIKNKPILVTLLTVVVIPVTALIALSINTFTSGTNSKNDNIGIIAAGAIVLSTQIKKKYNSEGYKYRIVYD